MLTRTKLSPRPDGSVGVDFVDVEYRPNGVAAAALLFEDGRDKPVGAVAFREFEVRCWAGCEPGRQRRGLQRPSRPGSRSRCLGAASLSERAASAA